MAYYLTELYTAKPAWRALSSEQRQEFFVSVGAGMPALMALGIEPVTMGKVDGSKLHAAEQTFFAVWRCPNDAALETLVGGIAETGWHDYFDTLNAGGEGTDLMGHLAQLSESA
jgi:hypothetical protein